MKVRPFPIFSFLSPSLPFGHFVCFFYILSIHTRSATFAHLHRFQLTSPASSRAVFVWFFLSSLSIFPLSLFLCTRPLLVVSGFRTSGGWVLLLPLWLQRPLQSHHHLFLSLLPLSLYPHSCGGAGVGHRVIPGPFTTTTSAERIHSLTVTRTNTYRHTHTTTTTLFI